MTVAHVTHRLRHVIKTRREYLDEVRNSEAVRDLAGYGCLTRMRVVRLLASVSTRRHSRRIRW